MDRRTAMRLAVITLLPLAAACSSAPKAAPVAILAAPPELPKAAQLDTPTRPPEDPVLTLLAESDRHFKAGQNELSLGHVSGAREEFDRAIAVLIESPYGGRTEPRIREQFDRLVDRISTYEVKALAQEMPSFAPPAPASTIHKPVS